MLAALVYRRHFRSFQVESSLGYRRTQGKMGCIDREGQSVDIGCLRGNQQQLDGDRTGCGLCGRAASGRSRYFETSLRDRDWSCSGTEDDWWLDCGRLVRWSNLMLNLGGLSWLYATSTSCDQVPFAATWLLTNARD